MDCQSCCSTESNEVLKLCSVEAPRIPPGTSCIANTSLQVIVAAGKGFELKLHADAQRQQSRGSLPAEGDTAPGNRITKGKKRGETGIYLGTYDVPSIAPGVFLSMAAF